ncbi:hypothetical protein ACU4GH_36885 [Bradyrhizobium betae]
MHAFEKGVHAVVGINGLGKTTFLTILYRILLGPFDQSKSDEAGLLGSQHELSKWRNKNFFRERVADGAAEATVEADVAFGKNQITIKRALSNLDILYLSENGQQLEANQDLVRRGDRSVVWSSHLFRFFRDPSLLSLLPGRPRRTNLGQALTVRHDARTPF